MLQQGVSINMEIEKRHKDLYYGGGQDLNLNVVLRRGGEGKAHPNSLHPAIYSQT